MRPLPLMLSPSFLLLVLGLPAVAQESDEAARSVRAKVQPRPGAAMVEIDMLVHAVPIDPPLVAAGKAKLAENELVLGVERDGAAVAFPISTLANFEVMNSRIGELPLAPTW
jgi:hypothetical protein